MRADLEALRLAPVIFQEFVPLGRDIRVASMPPAHFAAAVTRHRPEAHLDWRLDTEATWTPIPLGDEMRREIERLLAGLGLRYGSLDFRETPEGEWVFLEVNPAGQFLFLEPRDAHHITDAFCSLLLSAEPSRDTLDTDATVTNARPIRD